MDEEQPKFVQLPSGKVVPLPRTTLISGEETPEHLLKWIEKHGDKWPPRNIAFRRKLCTDKRMVDFWAWLSKVRFNRLDKFRSSLTVSEEIYRRTRLPGFPGDLTPAQREGYFKKVRAHTQALRELLRGTIFDQCVMDEVREEDLKQPLSKALASWGEDEAEDGHTVAFQVTPEGKFHHHYEYPRNVLTDTLFDVMEWTCWDDGWDGNFFSTSAPIAQSNSESTPLIYFCCTIHAWFHDKCVEIPFPILATLANVALDLPPDRQADEDAVRKQVRRYQARRAKQRQSRDNAFSDRPGQNSGESADSVLSEPF